jgi:general secretion pathway protein E
MQSGYKGRTGIFEFLKLSENLQSLILKTSEANQIRQAAVEEGMKTLRQAGIEQALQGKTSFDEVLRVTQE